MAQKTKPLGISTASLVAFALFAAGLFAAVGSTSDRSLLKAEIIVVPYFGAVSEQQPDPWTVRLEDFVKYGNPLYYWEAITK